MAGRGFKDEVEPIVNDKLLVLRNGRWWKMYVPVNPDRVTAGINLVESFADLYARDNDVEVGIIPCADGGTSIEQWEKGGVLFDHACYMAELASRSSEIVAVLWHQGESDCIAERAALYEERLSKLIDDFREKLNIPTVPFIIGGLGEYLNNYSNTYVDGKLHTKINEALMNVAKKKETVGFVSAEGLDANPDNLHFSAAALREFGIRYYNEFLRFANNGKTAETTPSSDSFKASEIEAL